MEWKLSFGNGMEVELWQWNGTSALAMEELELWQWRNLSSGNGTFGETAWKTKQQKRWEEGTGSRHGWG
jgi:hypothetical protein